MGAKKDKPRSSVSKIMKEVEGEEAPLSPEWAKEIKRRVREMESPIRYIITSALSRRFVFYYNVSTDTFAVNNPEQGTLFKRQEVAACVAEILGPGYAVVKFTIRNGVLKRLSPYQYRLGNSRRKKLQR
ncbi:MAG: hypothetical protein RI101_01060 [Nitrospira sp.]|nr:hypothetical protein [Nitrospira sp.]